MDYNLYTSSADNGKKKSTFTSLKSLVSHMVEEKRILITAFIAMQVAAALTLLGPLLIGHTIDAYIQTKQFHGVLVFSGILLVMYIISLFAGYLQTKLMGTVGQRMLFTLRNALFNKIQELPYDFFNQNKAGDLISRLNNDTDKVNQFFSQSLMQFVRSILVMIGAGIFLLSINLELGAAALAPAVIIWLITRFASPWVKKRNSINLKSVGNLSSEVQESLNNFKVIVAFNRRDYFRRRFDEANQDNYNTSVKAGIANNLFMPVYTFFSNIGQLVVLTFGIYLISTNHFTIGLLISFLAYITNFYNPLRQLASLWASFQVAMAAWDRIARILNMENNMPLLAVATNDESKALLSFRNVSFTYPNGTEVLHHINFDLEKGKTYAFVGPTGGGKTTTASLISRLYDPTSGTVWLDGRNIGSYTPEERSRKIGFILQEPFLFSGTIRDNILYGNEAYREYKDSELTKLIHNAGLESLLQRFDQGLDTKVDVSGDGISLGQKQLIAFMRAVLRQPDLLILDEATANIDTVTEQLLDEILQKLPTHTTKVIIAHRLNTIANADEIYFVNSGEVTRAGSLADAVQMLKDGKMAS
ncbi:multidrug ABC transporter ATP-binding protein [Prolixibacter bellariivorans]|uniref:Multidrug ABC transporter ATP-binding protein n=1 Tax=Prolixibacter bellariivorans TaxID=314319 RepID=A0A5M4B2M8_9BACT|nr:ABC transporter ATP-binding protein [Prolixibacter bellariivorans]GET34415.1 multidrug ABC transporter ATP-binding protein [Prolixibacter bellariivorans]